MTILAGKKRTRFGTAQSKGLRHTFWVIAILFFMFFLLRNSEIAKNAVLTGLRRAAMGVLPAVFPFLVLSDLLASTGGLPHRMSAWLSPIFGLPACACSAILLGWICGFPIGAVYAAKEAERGNIGQEDFAKTVAAASIPSPAFLIGVVGNGILRDAKAGVFLWLFCMLSSAILCIISGKKHKILRKVPQKTLNRSVSPFFKVLTGSVRNAAGVSLNLCAFIAFFSVLLEAIKAVFTRFGVPAIWEFAVAALLELSGGIFSASALSHPLLLPFCAAACGWSGFSVHFQIFSVCEKVHLKYGNYLLAKAAQALFCFVFAWIWQRL